MDSSTTSQPSRVTNLTIRAHPFNSPESASLIKELDNELSVMYPDWTSLPHPGENIGLLAHNETLEKPKAATLADPLTALDSKSDSVNTAAAAAPSILEQAVDDDGEGLHFFIAFASTRDHEIDETDDDHNQAREQKKEGNNQKEDPVGCIALRLSPYFPSHHPPSAYTVDRRPMVEKQIRQEQWQSQQSGPIMTAQLKRLYVLFAYRSKKVINPSVATRLVEFAEGYAREHLGVQRLVLETGTRQRAAIGLYERRGWKVRECFGDYLSSSTQVGGVSVCYELRL